MLRDSKRNEHFTLEDARCTFKNFEGREQKYNSPGDRNFCLLLDDEELIDKLIKDGWNIKHLKPRDEDEGPQPYVQVNLGYSPKARPPKVVMISSRGRTELPEEMVNLLDWVTWRTVDLTFRPYHWDFGGKQGIKAMLVEIYVTIEETKLDLKYADVPEASLETIGEDAV